MASHSRTVSESSFELVKTDDETHEPLIPKQEEMEENHDVLSLNDEISSEDETSEDETSDEESSEEESSDEEDNTSKLLMTGEKSVPFSGIGVEGVANLTVEIPEESVVAKEQAEQLVTLSEDKKDSNEAEKTVLEPVKDVPEKALESLECIENKDTPTESGKEEAVIQKARAVTVEETPKKKEKTVEKKQEVTAPILVEKDPLGAVATPIVEPTPQKEQKAENAEENTQENTTIRPSIESILMAESSTARYEREKNTRCIEILEEQVSRLTRRIESIEHAEEQRRKKLLPPTIQQTIRGVWRPIKMEQHDTSLIINRVPFAQRWRSLMSHVSYDYSHDRLSQYSKLCCKTYGHSELYCGVEMPTEEGTTTFVRDATLVTIWTDSTGKTTEERSIKDGKLHVVHTNSRGYVTTRIYERVTSKVDVLISIGNTCRHYLKFW